MIKQSPSQKTLSHNTRNPFTALLSLLKYLAIFLVIYTFINWWRQPIMPDKGLELAFTDSQGHSIDLNEMSQESPVLIYFWGTWCGVCSVSSPKVNALNDDGYPVVSIAVESGSDQEIRDYMQGKEYDFPVINDSNSHIFDSWQGQVTPSYIILHNGKAVQGMTGIQPLWSMKLRLWISKL